MSMMGAITGILASRGNYYEYFTTVLYPIITEDTISVSLPAPVDGELWYIPDDLLGVSTPTLQSGTLIPTIVYKTYNEPLAAESATMTVPTLLSGTLTVTINYITYNEPLAAESATMTVPTLLSGTLV